MRGGNHDDEGGEGSETHVVCWWEVVDDVMDVEC